MIQIHRDIITHICVLVRSQVPDHKHLQFCQIVDGSPAAQNGQPISKVEKGTHTQYTRPETDRLF